MRKIQSVAIVLVFLLAASCGPAPATTGTTATADDAKSGDVENDNAEHSGGGSITDFALKDVNGKTHALSDYLGKKVILISFWATWCEPCKKEMVQLNKLWKQYKDQDLLVISISMDEPESQGDVAPYIKQRGYEYPVLIDAEGAVTNQMNPRRAAPFTLIIDKSQNIVWEHESYIPGDEKKIEEAIVKIIGASAK